MKLLWYHCNTFDSLLNLSSVNLISSWNRRIKFIMKCDDVYKGMEGARPSWVSQSHSHPIHQHAWLTWTRVCTMLDTWYIYRIFTKKLYIYCIYLSIQNPQIYLHFPSSEILWVSYSIYLYFTSINDMLERKAKFRICNKYSFSVQ